MRPALLTAICLFVALCGCSWFFPELDKIEMPAGVKSVGIATGADKFSSSVFLKTKLEHITDIRMGQFDGKGEPELGVAGRNGAEFFDSQLSQKWSVSFESGKMFFFTPPMPETDEVNFVDVEGDGVTEFLNRGHHHMFPTTLYDSSGKVRWKFDALMKDDAAAADVDGDGKLEIVVGFGGGTGVRLFSHDGKERWTQSDGNVWRVAMLDVNGDGQSEILHSNAGGDLTVRDSKGKALEVREHGIYVGHFSLTRWGDGTTPTHVLALDDGAIHIFSRDGRAVIALTAPGCDRLGDAFATTIKFGNSAPLFATVIGYKLFNRSLLYIHDLKGKLIYQEAIEKNCGAIYALPGDSSERLLLGCGGQIREYSPASQAARTPK